MEYDSTIILD